MTPTDLIARLEEATEGSRELDAEIALTVFPALMECRSDPEQGEGHWIHPRYGKTYALDYTTSIDAAATLYPEMPERVPSDPLNACIEALKARETKEND